MFDALSVWEAAMLATMLAATDAALGKAVITNKAVPARLRESLNVESGLNDGLCVPILFLFIALELGTGEGSASGFGLILLAEELGLGLLVGVGVTFVGGWLLRVCWRRGWVSDVWVQMTTVALAISCFAVAQRSFMAAATSPPSPAACFSATSPATAPTSWCMPPRGSAKRWRS